MTELLLSRPNLGATRQGTPVWEMAYFYPVQGEWSESEYLSLESHQFLVEFDNGYLEFLTMPTMEHQSIVAYLYELLVAFVRSHQLGKVWFAPLPVRLWTKKYREPDIIFLTNERLNQNIDQYPERDRYPAGADLVIEVVSDSVQDRYRDLVEKREEYAQAGIAEYWIVDPEQKRITVLHLSGKKYGVHGEFGEEERATSPLLDGFEVEVTAVFAAAS
jgi:Uma2 family endonuclease